MSESNPPTRSYPTINVETVPKALTLLFYALPALSNLSRKEEEIPWKNVAGFDYRSGVFWDQVIETRGQSSSKMTCLAKSDGKRIRQVLQDLES